jgi:RHS repeat-associated protein
MNQIVNSESIFTFTFTGRETDKAVGLQATPNRRFDPAVGRWLDTEPIGYYQGDADLHRYASNQPE